MTRPCSEILRELRGMLDIDGGNLIVDACCKLEAAKDHEWRMLDKLYRLLAEADAALAAHLVEHFFDNAAVPPGHPRAPAPPSGWTAEALAREFHDLYETAAADHGYVTRPETRTFDPESPNGRLMIDVCHNILRRLASPPPAPDDDDFNDHDPNEGLPPWA